MMTMTSKATEVAVPLRALDIHSHETKVNAEALDILQRYAAMAKEDMILSLQRDEE